MHFQKKVMILETTACPNKVTLHSCLTLFWCVWTDCFSIRETHVRFSWNILWCLMHFQKKWLSLKPQHLQSKAKLHSLLTVLWSIWTDFFPIRETHVCFPWKLLRSLLHFQKKVIIWKLSIYIVMKHSIHSHRALKFFNRLLLFHRIKSGFLLNDSQKLNALSKRSDYLWNHSIYKVKQDSIHFSQWFEVFEQTSSLLEKHMCVSHESF